MLQETHSTPDIENKWKSEWGSDMYFCHHTSASRGAMILCAPHIQTTSIETDNSGRLVLMSIQKDNKTTLIANIYAPNDETEQIEFFNALNRKLSGSIQYDVLIIGGDFNVHLNNIDKRGGQIANKRSKSSLRELMGNHLLIDIWRTTHPGQQQFTWEQPTKKIMTRLDYFLISRELSTNVIKCEITESLLTDHKLVYLLLNQTTPKKTRGPGFWKFNNSLLLDKTFSTIRQLEIHGHTMVK